MENLNLALVSSPKPLLLGHSSSRDLFTRRKPFTFGRFSVSAKSSSSHVIRAAPKSGIFKNKGEFHFIARLGCKLICHLSSTKYAMQQAFKTMMGQMNTQNNPFDSSTFSPGSPFPFPMPSPPGPAAPASSAGNQSQATSARPASQYTVTVDTKTKVEAAPGPHINVKDKVEGKKEPKKPGNIQSLLRTSIFLMLDYMYYMCNL
ncbi:translocon Tic40 [Trifolium pratense]|uniref:Translocon Tic40 n=1 Tax=Trifolium pratense TaxID=57577 RepID=A0A2K3L7U6_TRIPR|nr:translocon Tic40 [Trifolium pratense]